jgi:hypothetical protein
MELILLAISCKMTLKLIEDSVIADLINTLKIQQNDYSKFITSL